MRTPSNLPPGETGQAHDLGQVAQHCKNGHQWFAQMFSELGGGFYVDELEAACPTCGEEDLQNDRSHRKCEFCWESYRIRYMTYGQFVTYVDLKRRQRLGLVSLLSSETRLPIIRHLMADDRSLVKIEVAAPRGDKMICVLIEMSLADFNALPFVSVPQQSPAVDRRETSASTNKRSPTPPVGDRKGGGSKLE